MLMCMFGLQVDTPLSCRWLYSQCGIENEHCAPYEWICRSHGIMEVASAYTGNYAANKDGHIQKCGNSCGGLCRRCDRLFSLHEGQCSQGPCGHCRATSARGGQATITGDVSPNLRLADLSQVAQIHGTRRTQDTKPLYIFRCSQRNPAVRDHSDK